MTEEEKIRQALIAEKEQEFINQRATGQYATPQTTPPETATVIGSPEQVDAKSRKEKIMQDLFSYRQEKPGYDPNRPQELKRLANASVIAKGINLIGDNIALANKANVNQKTPDNAERAYLGNMYNYLDDYTRRVDEWNYRDFANKLRTGELALREANSDEENARRNKLTDQQQEQWKKEWEWREGEIKRAKEIGDYQHAKLLEREQIDHKNRMQEYGIRYDGSERSSGSDKKGDGVIIKTKSGQEYKLAEQDASLIYDDMLRNIDVLQASRPDLFEPGGEYDAATGKEKPVLKKGTTEEQLIRAYLEWKEEQAAKQPAVQQQPPIKYPGFPGREGEKLPEQSQFGKWKQNTPQQPAQTIDYNNLTF